MLLIDQALARRAASRRPIQVGIIGAGTLGTGIVHQIMRHVPGMTVAALFNRHIEKAQRAFAQAGVDCAIPVRSLAELEKTSSAASPPIPTTRLFSVGRRESM